MSSEMPVISGRAFRWGDDVQRMHALIVDSWKARGPRNTFHIGDLHWRLRAHPGRDPISDIHLWEEGDRDLAGFAWFDPPESGDILSHPETDRSDLENEMIGWLERRRLREKGKDTATLTTGGFQGDQERAGLLELRGYSPTSVGYPHHLIPLDVPLPNPDLPGGFGVHSVADGGDLEKRAQVHQRAWGTRNLTLEIYQELSRGEYYRPEFDVVTVSPDGQYAASCLAWLDVENSTALFEPVGCDPEYRRRGLTRAAILFCLTRLKEAGVRAAAVNTSTTNLAGLRLYESCGFRRVGTDYDWVKRLS